MLQTQQIVLARIAYLTQFIEFGIHAVAYHIAAIEQIRGIGIDFASYAVANELAQIELLAYAAKHLAIACFAQAFNGLDGCQCGSQLHQFARCDASHSHFRHQSLEVAYGFELLLELFACFGVLEEMFHHIEAAIDLLHIFEREQYPSAQQASTHR